MTAGNIKLSHVYYTLVISQMFSGVLTTHHNEYTNINRQLGDDYIHDLIFITLNVITEVKRLSK